MPRVSTKVVATPQTLPPAPLNAPLSPLIQVLRGDWRWASISQFLWTFGQAAGLTTWDIDLFEADLDSPEPDVLTPETVTKFLYILTYDKTVNRQTLEDKLRTQYLLRSPKQNPFGPADTPVRPWAELGLSDKVDALYKVCEWQWTNPMKFRTLMNDDEPTAWRIEPIGWDKLDNTYWLFDDNRLWVQHPAPKPPKPPVKPKGSAKKSKQTKPKASSSKGKAKPKSKPQPVEVDDDEELSDAPEEPVSTPRSSRRGKRNLSPSLEIIQKLIAEDNGLRSTRKRTREQLEQEEEPSSRRRTRGNALPPVTPARKPAPGSPAMASGRSTRRTRANAPVEDEWQAVPDEWLTPTRSSAKIKPKAKIDLQKKAKLRRTGLESDADDSSELSELSDGSELSELSDEEEEEKVDQVPEKEEQVVQVVDEGVVNGHQNDVEMVAPEVLPEQAEPEINGEETEPAAQADGRPDEEMQGIETETAEVPEESEQEINRAASPLAQSEEVPVPETVESSEIDVSKQMDVDTTELKFGEDVDKEQAEATISTAEAGPSTLNDIKPIEEPIEPKAEQVESGEIVAPSTVDPVPEEKTVMQEMANEIQEAKEEEEEVDPDDEVLLAAKKARNPGYVEWECVCATRWDWENWPEQFAASRHPDEKAFYQHIVENTRPAVMVTLREKEIQRAKEEALRNRKRSSRIAMRELEREEQLRAEEAQKDLELRMQRIRDDENKAANAEADRIAREREREDRLKEREDRLRQREEAITMRAMEEIKAREEAERAREHRASKRLLDDRSRESERPATPASGSGTKKGKRKPARKRVNAEEDEEKWELACEGCKQHGWNVDDGRNIACCESCGKWQHTACHDQKDDMKGKPRRDWDKVDFYCSECKRRIARERHSDRRSAQTASVQGTPNQPMLSPSDRTGQNGAGSTPKLRFNVPQSTHASPTPHQEVRRVSQGNGQAQGHPQASLYAGHVVANGVYPGNGYNQPREAPKTAMTSSINGHLAHQVPQHFPPMNGSSMTPQRVQQVHPHAPAVQVMSQPLQQYQQQQHQQHAQPLMHGRSMQPMISPDSRRLSASPYDARPSPVHPAQQQQQQQQQHQHQQQQQIYSTPSPAPYASTPYHPVQVQVQQFSPPGIDLSSGGRPMSHPSLVQHRPVPSPVRSAAPHLPPHHPHPHLHPQPHSHPQSHLNDRPARTVTIPASAPLPSPQRPIQGQPGPAGSAVHRGHPGQGMFLDQAGGRGMFPPQNQGGQGQGGYVMPRIQGGNEPLQPPMGMGMGFSTSHPQAHLQQQPHPHPQPQQQQQQHYQPQGPGRSGRPGVTQGNGNGNVPVRGLVGEQPFPVLSPPQ